MHARSLSCLAFVVTLSVIAAACEPPSAMPAVRGTPANVTAVAAVATRSGCSDVADGVPCANRTSTAPARVIRIVDGDTLHVELDGRDETIRLYGIDAPEVGQPCAADAAARLRELAGDNVFLLADARDRDRYGRLLRYVYALSGSSIDAALVRDGLAHAWRADGALRGAIGALEDAARVSGHGCLWKQM